MSDASDAPLPSAGGNRRRLVALLAGLLAVLVVGVVVVAAVASDDDGQDVEAGRTTSSSSTSSASSAPVDDRPLVGTTWVLASATPADGDAVKPADDAWVSLRVVECTDGQERCPTGHRIGGSDGCNQWGGSVTIDGDALRLE